VSLKGSVEAALFAFASPVTPEDLGRLIGSPPDEVTEALVELKGIYQDRDGGLQVKKGRGGTWVLEIKPRYVDLVTRLVPVEMDGSTLKTLALIAVMQPVLQSEIIHRRGDRAYQHVRDLVKLNYLKKERDGRSYCLTTTNKFGKEFRFREDPDEVRKQLLAQLGVSEDDAWLRPLLHEDEAVDAEAAAEDSHEREKERERGKESESVGMDEYSQDAGVPSRVGAPESHASHLTGTSEDGEPTVGPEGSHPEGEAGPGPANSRPESSIVPLDGVLVSRTRGRRGVPRLDSMKVDGQSGPKAHGVVNAGEVEEIALVRTGTGS